MPFSIVTISSKLANFFVSFPCLSTSVVCAVSSFAKSTSRVLTESAASSVSNFSLSMKKTIFFFPCSLLILSFPSSTYSGCNELIAKKIYFSAEYKYCSRPACDVPFSRRISPIVVSFVSRSFAAVKLISSLSLIVLAVTGSFIFKICSKVAK